MMVRRWESGSKRETRGLMYGWVYRGRGKKNSAVLSSKMRDRNKGIYSKRKWGTKIEKGWCRTMKNKTSNNSRFRKVINIENAACRSENNVKENNNKISRCRATATLNF